MQTNAQTQQLPEQTKKKLSPKDNELSMSERFTQKIIELGGSIDGMVQVTEGQKRLIQGYSICIERALNAAEERRISKNNSNSDHKYDENLPVKWNNVNIDSLALDLVHYARLGLDMMQDNHLFPIPFKNNRTNQYDINLMEGYNGIRYIAEKYAFEPPVNVIAELVYSTDKFTPIKKSLKNKVEGYEFEITNAFDRGEIIGGFGYIEYKNPEKNKLVIMTLKDILKRKPEYASAEFWGGTKKMWENGKKVTKETDGWFEEMCLKTIKREVYSAKHIPRDPQKIDDAYEYLRQKELRNAEIEAHSEIDTNAGTVIIDADNVIDTDISVTETDKNVIKSNDNVIDVDTETGEIIDNMPVSGTPEPLIPEF